MRFLHSPAWLTVTCKMGSCTALLCTFHSWLCDQHGFRDVDGELVLAGLWQVLPTVAEPRTCLAVGYLGVRELGRPTFEPDGC